jgi:hypothetical protein
MSTATTTSTDTGQHTTTRDRQRETQQPVTQQERSAAQRARRAARLRPSLIPACSKTAKVFRSSSSVHISRASRPYRIRSRDWLPMTLVPSIDQLMLAYRTASLPHEPDPAGTIPAAPRSASARAC